MVESFPVLWDTKLEVITALNQYPQHIYTHQGIPPEKKSEASLLTLFQMVYKLNLLAINAKL